MADSAKWLADKEDNKGIIVNFYNRPIEDTKKTAAEGRVCCVTQIFIEKRIPGDQLVRIDRQKRENEEHRYPEAWNRYLMKKQNSYDGTPLEKWADIDQVQVMELKALNIHTVEHLVSCSDGVAYKIPYFHNLRKKGKAFLELCKDIHANEKLNDELKDKDEKIEELNLRLAALENKSNLQDEVVVEEEQTNPNHYKNKEPKL